MHTPTPTVCAHISGCKDFATYQHYLYWFFISVQQDYKHAYICGCCCTKRTFLGGSEVLGVRHGGN